MEFLSKDTKALMEIVNELENSIHWYVRKFIWANDGWDKSDAIQNIIDAMDDADYELEELALQIGMPEKKKEEDEDEVQSHGMGNPRLYELFQRFYATNMMGDPAEEAVIIFTSDSFDIPPKDEKMRSYRVRSDEPIFHGNPVNRVMYGTCLGEAQKRVRLDLHIFDMKAPWKVEDVYYLSSDGDAPNAYTDESEPPNMMARAIIEIRADFSICS